MQYKFEKLEVWQLSVELLDAVYQIIKQLPSEEKFNLASQIRRAATSIGLNIAEGSTSTSNADQSRFLGYSIRSLIETLACLRIIEHRNYISDRNLIDSANNTMDTLFIKLQAFRKALN